MSLRGVAKDTMHITDEGRYQNPEGEWVDISASVQHAIEDTCTYTPHEVMRLCDGPDRPGQHPLVTFMDMRTQEAAWQLVTQMGVTDLALLSFASARNPSGGFLRGAKAQEEDLARCSALYRCVGPQREYYESNEACRSMLYTDHIIYSPKVPFFRRKNRDLLSAPFEASVITAPAPNATQAMRRDPDCMPEVEQALRRRAAGVLAVAEAEGHRTVLLGAWGCGVFGCPPEMVAGIWGELLSSPRFAGAFDWVIFAVYEPVKRRQTAPPFQALMQTSWRRVFSDDMRRTLSRLRHTGSQDQLEIEHDAVVMTHGLGDAVYLSMHGDVFFHPYMDDLEGEVPVRPAKHLGEVCLAIHAGAKIRQCAELTTLLPRRPDCSLECTHCQGRGRHQHAGVEMMCFECFGMGWSHPAFKAE
ncbi:MAG: TIGR02452 family protein [Bradymonadia bacterium]